MQVLLKWDHHLHKLINYYWQNSFFDWLMPLLRNATIWWPLYFFLCLFALINFKKTGWIWMLFFGLTVVLSNYVSSDLIKGNVFRLRPCNNPEIADWLRVLIGKNRPQSSSFTSSHAANHFAMAVFLYQTFKKQFGQWPLVFFLWAAGISYAQVYVGVHYPLDVTAGAVVGCLIGLLTAYFFNRKWQLL